MRMTSLVKAVSLSQRLLAGRPGESAAATATIATAAPAAAGSSGSGGGEVQLAFPRRVSLWRGADSMAYREGFVQKDSWQLHDAVLIKQVRPGPARCMRVRAALAHVRLQARHMAHGPSRCHSRHACKHACIAWLQRQPVGV